MSDTFAELPFCIVRFYKANLRKWNRAEATRRRYLADPRFRAKVLAQSAIRYQRTKQRRRELAKQRLLKDPERQRLLRRKRYQREVATYQGKVARSLRRHTQRMMEAGAVRLGTSEAMLGATRAEFIRHLEAQFLPGMSWDNYGTAWHIDHIRPLASFDLSAPDQVRRAAHISNLRPLWAKDNLSKGARLVA